MFADPENIIAQFDLQSGSRVADLGAGAGTFSLAAARAVGDAGAVYAIEIQKPLLERLKKEAKEAHLRTVEVLWGDIERREGTHLKEGSVDAVIVANVLFQLDDVSGLAAEVERILRPGGKALTVDWSESFGHTGPHPDHVVTEKAAREIFEKAGLKFVKSIMAGAHHYGMIFRKA